MCFAVLVTNAFQLGFFYGTSWTRVRSDLRTLAADTGVAELTQAGVAGVIFFQVISCRSAGFQVLDIKRLADCMGVVFGFMFWLAPHPLVAALKEAEDSERLQHLGVSDDAGGEDQKGDDVEEVRRPMDAALVAAARDGADGGAASATGLHHRATRLVNAAVASAPSAADLEAAEKLESPAARSAARRRHEQAHKVTLPVVSRLASGLRDLHVNFAPAPPHKGEAGSDEVRMHHPCILPDTLEADASALASVICAGMITFLTLPAGQQ